MNSVYPKFNLTKPGTLNYQPFYGNMKITDCIQGYSNKLSGKTDPSEIDRTYNIRKQQTLFN